METVDHPPSGAYVPVGAAISYAAVAALDELAQKRGPTRSALLRAVIDRCLTETMARDPDLFARYLATPPAPSRSRRPARQFSLITLKQKAGGVISTKEKIDRSQLRQRVLSKAVSETA